MESGFYNLDGYEPWECSYKSEKDLVIAVLEAHLCYVTGKIKPEEKIQELISGKYSCHERSLPDDIIYNLDKFRQRKEA